jgi:phage terminase small subunit
MTPRQASFLKHYFRDFNAKMAAIRAGYNPKSAAIMGHRLLRHPKVLAAIEARAADEERGLITEADRVVLEFMRIAFSDIRQYLNQDAEARLSLVESDALPHGASAAVAAVRTRTGSPYVYLRLQDKARALRALAKRVGFFERRDHFDIMAWHREVAEIRRRVLTAGGIPCDENGIPDEAHEEHYGPEGDSWIFPDPWKRREARLAAKAAKAAKKAANGAEEAAS